MWIDGRGLLEGAQRWVGWAVVGRVQKGETDLTIVDYNLEWERHQQEREFDRKRARAALFMQKIYRCVLRVHVCAFVWMLNWSASLCSPSIWH